MNKNKLNYLFNAKLQEEAVEGLKNICNTFKISKKDVLYLLFYTLTKQQIINIIKNNKNYDEVKGRYRSPKNYFNITLQNQFYLNNKLKNELEALAEELNINKNNFINFLLEYFKDKENLELL